MAVTPLSDADNGMYAAIAANDAACLQGAIASGASINRVRGITCETPLMEAAKRGLPDMCRILIAAGADAHARDVFNYTAYQYVMYQDAEVADIVKPADDVVDASSPSLSTAFAQISVSMLRGFRFKSAVLKKRTGVR